MRVLIGADGQPAQNRQKESNSRSSPQPEEEGEPPRKKPKGDDISSSDGNVGPCLEAPFKSEEGSSSSSGEEIMGGGGRLASSSSGPEAAAPLQGGGGVPGEEEGDGQRERRRAEGPGEDEGPRAAATAAAASPHRSAPPRARPRSDRHPEDDDDEWHDDRGSSSRCIFPGKSNDGEGRPTYGDDGQSPSSRGHGKSGRSGRPSSSSSLLRPSAAAAPAPLLHGPVPGSADDPATVAKSDRPFDDRHNTAEDVRNTDDAAAPAEAPEATLARFVRLLKTKHRPSLDVVAMDGDGNCLFRALSLQVYGDPSMHAEVRRRILDFMEREADHFRDFVADEDFAQYVARKRVDGVHGNHAEIQAASELYCRSAEVYVPRNGLRPINIFHSEYAGLGDAPLRLLYTDGNHYDAVVDPLVPTAGLGLGLPGLQPGLADRMQVAEATQRSETSAGAAERRQLEEATKMSERARKEREDAEVREALKKSAGDMATVKTPYYAGDSDEERMYQKKALYLSEIEAADFDLEQAVLASSLESYHRAEHERKPSSSMRRGDAGRRSRCNASPRGLRSTSNSPVYRTAAAASAAASPSSHPCAAVSSSAAAASSVTAPVPSASSQPTAAGLNHSASLTTDEYPPSVQELVMNGFEPSKVLRAYDLVGDSFDDLLSVLLSSTAT